MNSGDGGKERIILNHMPDRYKILSDGIIREIPTPSAHYAVMQDGSVEMLVKPEAVSWGPIIHKEPDCLGYNRCTQREPHEHGFACDKTCIECWGQCHSDCPANEVHNGKYEKE